MRNSGSESSASSHTPPPNEEIPRHRSGGGGSGGNASNASPHWRGANSPRHPLEMNLFTPPRPAVTPVIGVPGRSAFMPYRPPTQLGPAAGPSPVPGPSGGGAPGFHGTIAFAGPSRIGGSPITGRKRGREGGVGTSGGGGSGGNEAAGEEGERNIRECSVCHKRFGSKKALFGHMRSHPDRGWKGVHPPPVFKADEEFADIRVAAAAALDEAAAVAEEQEEDGSGFKVPDLNKPPPPDP